MFRFIAGVPSFRLCHWPEKSMPSRMCREWPTTLAYGIPKNERISMQSISKQLHFCRAAILMSRASAASSLFGPLDPSAVAEITPAIKKNVHPAVTSRPATWPPSNVLASRRQPPTTEPFSSSHPGGKGVPGAISRAPALNWADGDSTGIEVYGWKFGMFTERAFSSLSWLSASCFF
jgi:hypothetical protein